MSNRKNALTAALLSLSVLFLSACGGDDGKNGRPGAAGENGEPGESGLSSLTTHQRLPHGDAQCFDGGIRIDSGLDDNRDGELAPSEVDQSTVSCDPTQLNEDKNFNRIASYPVCRQLDDSCNTDTETAAEIVTATQDGNTLIYTDSPGESLGFVDISTPDRPQGIGVVALGGEPTSVAIKGDWALVGVNTSEDYVNVSGVLAVVDIASRSVVRRIDLAGQPDSVAVSPDGRFAAVAIENERDEDLNEGALPQLPAGSLDIVDIDAADPAQWARRNVAMTGLAGLFPEDPEPEYVDINHDNIAVVSLQENNHLVLVDLPSGEVVQHFSAGTVDLDGIDTEEEKPKLIMQNSSLQALPREPDGVTWLSTDYFATANEGDFNGGSRGFSVFHRDGGVEFDSAEQLDQFSARVGHYPDKRSENKGSEPENAEFGVFGSERYLFVNAERANVTFVYDVADLRKPLLKQVLATGVAPEGALAIPSRNLLVVASEKDDRGDKFRSALNIYRYDYAPAQYPSIQSTNREDGSPIPWSALSSLAADPRQAGIMYSVEDSFYQRTRIFTIDTRSAPARLFKEMPIRDSNGILAAVPAEGLADDSVEDDHPSRVGVFDVADRAALVNDDGTVNLDAEGLAVASDGGFWLVSEGSGTVGSTKHPINSLNMLIKLNAQAEIESVVTLPESVNALQQRFGFEGVTEYSDEGWVLVAFQRAWEGEDAPRIGIYNPDIERWAFVFYPLESPASQNGGWVGLSDISYLGDNRFLLVERDNQAGPDAAIKRLYQFDFSSLREGDTVTKTLVRDLMPDLRSTGGLVLEKIEGLAVSADGDLFIVNDNDGLDDSNGETQLLNLGPVID